MEVNRPALDCGSKQIDLIQVPLTSHRTLARLHGKRKKRVRRGGAGSPWQRQGGGCSQDGAACRASSMRLALIKKTCDYPARIAFKLRPKYGGPERAYDR
jgi:hypothetical protein